MGKAARLYGQLGRHVSLDLGEHGELGGCVAGYGTPGLCP